MIDAAENRLASRNIALLEYYKGELKFLLPLLTTKCSMVEFAMDVTVLNTNDKAHLKNKGCHSSCPCSLISPFFFFIIWKFRSFREHLRFKFISYPQDYILCSTYSTLFLLKHLSLRDITQLCFQARLIRQSSLSEHQLVESAGGEKDIGHWQNWNCNQRYLPTNALYYAHKTFILQRPSLWAHSVFGQESWALAEFVWVIRIWPLSQ